MEKNHRRIVQNIWLISIFLISLIFSKTSIAQISIITDEETELFLQKISTPIFQNANIPFSRNHIFMVNDNTLNAFVSDGNYLFINTGTIMAAETDNELQGIIAHEVGHIQGGHILRSKLKIQELSKASLASILMAGAAIMASGRSDVGVAIMMGGQSSALASFLKYRIQEERNADEHAVKNLLANEISPIGLRNFLKKIEHQNTLTGIQEMPYFRTHPVTKERISFINDAIDKSPYKDNILHSKEFIRIKAKLFAYLNSSELTLKTYNKNNIEDKYARSFAYFKQLKKDKAIQNLDELIQLEPSNPFFYESKAQIYLETGDIENAIKEYKNALKFLPESLNIKSNLAQSIIENNPDNNDLKEAVKMLNQVVIYNPSYDVYILLSRAYGGLKQLDFAIYNSANANLYIGEIDVAKRQLNEVIKTTNSPQLKLKAEDLLNQINIYKKR